MILVALLFAVASDPVREVRVVMGSTAEVQAQGCADPRAALDAAFAALGVVDDQMSLWKESELVRLNRSGSEVVSPDLMAVLRQALEVASASGGAFDPTVEPLVRAAGFLTERPRQLSKRARAHLLGRVSASHVHLDPEARRVRLDPGTSLDLGGIAKGYAADLALAALRDRCVTSGLVDLGSSSIGAFGQSLEVQVRDPERADASPWASFRVTQGAVSTSGGDQRPGHILDPRTGRAADRVLSATVVADAGIEADALSTALFVLGADAGLDLLRRRGAAGFVLLREHGQALLRTTPGFAGDFSLTLAPGVAVQ